MPPAKLSLFPGVPAGVRLTTLVVPRAMLRTYTCSIAGFGPDGPTFSPNEIRFASADMPPYVRSSKSVPRLQQLTRTAVPVWRSIRKSGPSSGWATR